jgi:excisionase family DNA binding protein
MIFRKSRQKTGRLRQDCEPDPDAAIEGRGVDGNSERLLTPGEVAALFRVDPKTVTRWAASGRISSIRTPGGHRRFRESEVRALLRGDSQGTGDISAPH